MPAIEIQLQMRSDTAANWTSSDPILAVGEIGYETDSKNIKMGDGTTAWTSLSYYNQLTALLDVNTSTVTNRNVLVADGIDWESRALVEADISDLGTYVTAGAALTGFTGTAWRMFYTDTNGDVTELAFGTTDQVLTSTGATSAPIWQDATGGAGLLTEDADWNIIGGTGTTDPSGSRNFFIGHHATALGTVSGSDNICIGENTGNDLVGTGSNVFVGSNSGELCIASANVAVGYQTMYRGTTAQQNVSIGSQSGRAITTGDLNVAIGYRALGGAAATLTTNGNIAIGDEAMNDPSLSGANDNIAIGSGAGINITSGDDNTILGADAGTTIDTGTGNVCIGHAAGPTTNQSNQLFIDNTQTNTPLVHGDFSTNELTVNGSTSFSIGTLTNTATPSVQGQRLWLTGGTTTITDFVNGLTGQEIIILSEHAITITDGTNIFLAGSTNFTMANTDSLHLVQKADGNWYEISRSVN